MPWFTSKAQVLSMGLQVTAMALAVINAWSVTGPNAYLSLRAIIVYLLIAAVVVSVIASRGQQSRRALGPLTIEEARWTCVHDGSYVELKDTLQGLVNIEHDSLKVLINNELAEPCMKFHPELGGHGKLLHVKYSRGGKITKRPNEWLEL